MVNLFQMMSFLTMYWKIVTPYQEIELKKPEVLLFLTQNMQG
ncbi:hypothetical protein PHDIMM138B_20705 [Phytobacter diazotrophicus]